jgi:hypothetical protein
MADYYSLLARAVANLPKSSPPSTRRAIYERARKALTNQLRSLKPPLPESDIAREERALDEAVARLEADFEPAVAAVHALPTTDAAEGAKTPPAPAPPPPPAPRAEAPSLRTLAPEAPVLRPPAPGARPTAPKPQRAASPPPQPPSEPVRLPPVAPLRAPVLNAPSSDPQEAYESAFEPSLGAPSRTEPSEGDGAPSLGGARSEREPARPTLGEPLKPRSRAWLWVGGAVAVGFAGSIAVIALLMRPALQDLSPPAAPDSPVATSAPTPPEKYRPRVGSQTPDPTPSATPTAIASPETAPTLASTPPPAPTPTLTSTPPPAPTPIATVPVASRAAMLVATVADAAKPSINVGNAVWSLVPAPQGQPAGVGVKSEIDIPDLKLHASMVLRKNLDPSLPASHTIDLRISFDPGSPIKGVKDIALPLMRNDDPPAADALTGVRVKIADNYFLVGLNRADADVAKNIQEIGERGWFDFPMQLDDDRIAKLTFEKGNDGEKLIAQALAAWK